MRELIDLVVAVGTGILSNLSTRLPASWRRRRVIGYALVVGGVIAVAAFAGHSKQQVAATPSAPEPPQLLAALDHPRTHVSARRPKRPRAETPDVEIEKVHTGNGGNARGKGNGGDGGSFSYTAPRGTKKIAVRDVSTGNGGDGAEGGGRGGNGGSVKIDAEPAAPGQPGTSIEQVAEKGQDAK